MIISDYPKISIITPSYNQGEYIEQTILSIINQNYPNLEYIIIDGGSTDNTVEIIKKYEKHITYWVSEKDEGQSHAINKGLEKCTGDIFNWINSDDYLSENSLFEIGKLFTEHQPDMIIGNLRIFKEKSDKEHIYHLSPQPNIETELLYHTMSQPSMFYKMEVINALGKQVSQNLNYIMDLDLWCRFRYTFPNAKFIYTDSVLANFREHEVSKTVSESQKFEDETLQLTYTLFHKLGLTSLQINALIPKKYRHQIQDILLNSKLENIDTHKLYQLYTYHFFCIKPVSNRQKITLLFNYIQYKPFSFQTYKYVILDLLF